MKKTRSWALALAWLACITGLEAQTLVFDYPNLGEAGGLCLQGEAEYSGNRLRLTPGGAHRVGGAWVSAKHFLQGGFETTFQFRLKEPSEGFAFVIQNNALPALGPAGPGLGYGGVPNSLAVEFDITANAGIDDDWPYDISVHSRGALPNSPDPSARLGGTNGLPRYSNGEAHTARIVYSPGLLQVFLDDGPLPPVPVDLASLLNLDKGRAWVGFTGATGDSGEAQEILSWSLNLASSPLTISLTAPVHGASFLAPATIDLAATASTSAGSITRVEFFADAKPISMITSGAYTFNWEDVAPGTYWITAVASNDLGQFGVSLPAQVVVWPAQPPVGINFAGSVSGLNDPLAQTDLAGLIRQRNWNNLNALPNGDGSAPNLKNALDQGTTIDVTYNFAGSGEDPALRADISTDHRLMKAFAVDQGGAGGTQTNSTITVSQVPYSIYDVIVYSDGTNAEADRVGQFRIGTNSIFLRDGTWASFSCAYSQATGTNDQGPNTPAGNYVRFNGITTPNFTLFVTARSASDGTPSAVVNALQIVPSVYSSDFPLAVSRGPYLQTGTTNSVIVRWRTNRPVQGQVRYGSSPEALDLTSDESANLIEHTVALTALLPDTRYYYSVGTTETNLASGADYSFVTTPASGKPTRVWVLGDSGTANTNAMAVRNAYYALAEDRYTDVWLMLGDNAYNRGTDAEYQAAVFDMYPTVLRQTVLWSCIGNHETDQSHTPVATTPYLSIFNFPTNGEAGGVPSGTERYYSFDYGNIHFVCLDAMTSDRSSNGPMCAWLRADLDANTNFWLIAFWHHPPYTKGSHDSDNPNGVDFELVEMRENVVPILESYGVDLVLSGHSHCYERSFLLHGHYGYSTNLMEDMKLDGGSGRPEEDGPYVKGPSGANPYAGTVYVVAGSSGQATFGSLDHPAMFVSLLRLGSLILDIDTNRLDARFLRETGEVQDTFTLIKETGLAPLALPRITSITVSAGQVTLTCSAVPGKSYSVQRAASVMSPVWEMLAENLVATGNTLSWTGAYSQAPPMAFYRVVTSRD
jgi:hypothetical protein